MASHGAATAASARDFQWTSYEKRGPPPLPSLPPWAASTVMTSSPQLQPTSIYPTAAASMNGESAGGWKRQTSHFGAMKRLPQRGVGIEEERRQMAALEPRSEEEEHEQRGLPHVASTVDRQQSSYHQQHQPQYPQQIVDEQAGQQRGTRVETAASSAVTNQHDDDETSSQQEQPPSRGRDSTATEPKHTSSPSHVVVVEPLATQGVYFRPWKKKSASHDDEGADNNSFANDLDNSEDDGSASNNKWKGRALCNPFAKQRKSSTTQAKPPPQQQLQQFQPASDDRHDHDDDNPAEPSPVARVLPPKPRSASVIAKPANGASSPVKPAFRPRTPEPALAPAPIAVHQQQPRRPPLRSREAKLLPPPRHLESDDAIPMALASMTDLRKSTTVLAPLEPTLPPQQNNRNDRREDEDAVAHVLKNIPPKPPTQLQQLKQQMETQKKVKKNANASTLNALNEIERKRKERRNAHAQEKQRMETELKEHGDDVGYKFRRLIQKYRDALPPHQKASVPSTTPVLVPPVSSNQRLSVFVRKRPLAKKELKAKGYDVLTCLFAAAGPSSSKPQQQPHVGSLRKELMCHEPKLKVDCSESLENHAFHFDGVFDHEQDNSTIYSATVGPLLPFLVQPLTTATATGGAAAATTSLTVFAYGQTGSGKTYTMKSIYRSAASDLFGRLDGFGAHRVSVGVSFYEIYMNQVNDLLSGRARVQIMEDGDGVVQLLGLKEIAISSADELMELIKIGEDARATSANAVHDDSSRSHAMLRVTIYSASSAGVAGDTNTVLARLSMVDLAGSERACDTQSDSKSSRMEGAEINKSLLALKECVRALDRGATHIPFRQSKLTQLLRDSFLCANSKTVMIATVSPCSESCNHTLNTLRYADRLKEIGAN